MAEAEAAFRDALRLQPTFALPHARLATLLRGKLPDADLAALEERLADPRARPRPAGPAAVRPGPRPRRPRRFARAAECLRQANALTLELHRGTPRVRPGRSRALRRRPAAGVRSRTSSPDGRGGPATRAGRCSSSACRARARR